LVTPKERFDLEAIEGVRRRVVKFGERYATIARASSLGRYAVDLQITTLYWHPLHGPPGTYGWKTGDEQIVIRYSPNGNGDFIVENKEDALSPGDREHVVIIGSDLSARTSRSQI